MDFTLGEATNESQMRLQTFWERAKTEVDEIKTDPNSFKAQDLPLARIKKIMKLDEDVKSMMISAEAPILFAKAAELFIREITLRAWIHTERNKRRTLQRNDITMALYDGETDQFDFLIDIVPREELKTAQPKREDQSQQHQVVTQSAPQLSVGPGVQMATSQAIQAPQVAAQQVQQQPVQYVLQLPMGASNTQMGGQPIQIQVVPQGYQQQPQQTLTAGGDQQMAANTGGMQVMLVPQGGADSNSVQLQHQQPQTIQLQSVTSGGTMMTHQQQPQQQTVFLNTNTTTTTIKSDESEDPTTVTSTVPMNTAQQVYTTFAGGMQGQQMMLQMPQGTMQNTMETVVVTTAPAVTTQQADSRTN